MSRPPLVAGGKWERAVERNTPGENLNPLKGVQGVWFLSHGGKRGGAVVSNINGRGQVVAGASIDTGRAGIFLGGVQR